MWFCCQRHTGMPPVSRCFQIPAAPLSVKGSGCSRESGGRFVPRRRRRCPVGLLPACASPQRGQSLLRPELHLTCSSVGLAPTLAAFAGSARILQAARGDGRMVTARWLRVFTHTLTSPLLALHIHYTHGACARIGNLASGVPEFRMSHSTPAAATWRSASRASCSANVSSCCLRPRCELERTQPGRVCQQTRQQGHSLACAGHARLTLVGGVGWACSTGVCVSRGSEFALLAAHRHATGKSLFLRLLALSVKRSAKRESGGRFVLRRRRRCPVGLHPVCASPKGDRACLALIFS